MFLLLRDSKVESFDGKVCSGGAGGNLIQALSSPLDITSLALSDHFYSSRLQSLRSLMR